MSRATKPPRRTLTTAMLRSGRKLDVVLWYLAGARLDRAHERRAPRVARLVARLKKIRKATRKRRRTA